MMDVLTKENDSALELKFYPIVPNVINVLSGEFTKRYNKVQFRAVDDKSYNEMLEQKKLKIEESLSADAERSLILKMLEAGMDPASEEAKQQLSPENIKSLPEIEDYFSKSYRSSIEEWATHQLNVDEERFKMQELEERGFRDMLIADREFWHFRMLEDDYEVELWNPVLTFYQKSPDQRYIAGSNYVGKVDLMTVSDVVDKYGYLMDERQLSSLQRIYPARSAQYQVNGYQNDGSYYDATRSHAWNTEMPGLAYRQYASNYMADPARGGDILTQILSQSEDLEQWGDGNLMRISTIYWKTQRKVGHLTKIEFDGEVTQEIIDESFKVTEKPVYDTSIFKNKSKDTLLQGNILNGSGLMKLGVV